MSLLNKKMFHFFALVVTGLSIVLFCINIFIVFINTVTDDTHVDINIFYNAGNSFIHSGEMYQRFESYRIGYGPDTPTYKLPPAYQLTIIPFIKYGISYQEFLIINHVFYLLFYLLSVFLIFYTTFKVFSEKADKSPATESFFSNCVCFFIIIATWNSAFSEAYKNLHVEILIFFLLCLTLSLSLRSRVMSGFILSIASMLKIYPAFISAIYIFYKNKNALFGFLIGLMVINLFSIFYFGLQENIFYALEILPILLSEPVVNHGQNLSIAKFMMDHSLIDNINEITALMIKSGVLLILITTGLLVDKQSKKHFLLYFGMFTSGLLICMQNYWLQYQIILLIPLCILYAYSLDAKSKTLLLISMVSSIVICTKWEWFYNVTSFTSTQIQLGGNDTINYYAENGSFMTAIQFLDTSPVTSAFLFIIKPLSCIISLRPLIPVILFAASAAALIRKPD